MKKIHGLFIMALLLVAASPAGAADETTGGDQGWYVIHCNVYGAKVYLDDKYFGDIQQGTFTVPASTTGTPYKVLRVQKYGYSTFTDTITQAPGKGMTVDLYATLNALPSATETSVGGDVGWYLVHCNIDGATVLFDTTNRGEISRGVLYVPVYSTGTPYKTFTLQKEGYTTITANIPQIPGKGQTVDLYGTLNPVSAATATPTPAGGDIGYYAVHCNVDGATVSFNNEEKGRIANGSLTVNVYVTGTPYKTFTLYKSGYVPYTGTIEKSPVKGQTIVLSATLNPQYPETPAPVPTQKSPAPVGISLAAVLLVFASMGLRPRN